MLWACVFFLTVAVLAAALLTDVVLYIMALRARFPQVPIRPAFSFWGSVARLAEAASMGTLFLLFSLEDTPYRAWHRLLLACCFLAFVRRALELRRLSRSSGDLRSIRDSR